MGAAAALVTGGDAASAVLFAVPVAVLMQLVETAVMSMFSTFMPLAERRIDDFDIRGVVRIHYLCGVITFFVYFIPSAAAVYWGTDAIEAIVNWMPNWLQHALDGMAALLPALGFAMLLDVIMTKKLIPFLILGFVPAAFVGHDLSMVGIAAIAFALAMIIFNLYNDLQANSGPGADPQASPDAAPVPAMAGAAADPDNEWED
ncbi:MAG: PTS sugar transporter subunit IIC [Nocardioides sp.]